MDTWYQRMPPAAPVAQVLGLSPWLYLNASAGIQLLTISAGLISLAEIDTGSGFVPTIIIGGLVTLFPGQRLRLTYTLAPTVLMVQL